MAGLDDAEEKDCSADTGARRECPGLPNEPDTPAQA